MYPLVSICTPTYNRRPFISAMIRCFEHQDYPKDRMEWIILDDGTDPIGDLVRHIPQVKYYQQSKKLCLGEKRNLMHTYATGDFIVYMDDDDYYPPERVSHAVDMLQRHPEAMCAGSSILYIYYKHIDQIYQFGPYGANHATAGTFAFRKELLRDTAYDNSKAFGEEVVLEKLHRPVCAVGPQQSHPRLCPRPQHLRQTFTPQPDGQHRAATYFQKGRRVHTG